MPVGSAVQVATGDGYRYYSGLRSDPFFLDADGLRGGFQFTGHDTFAERNVFGMVLDDYVQEVAVPSSSVGRRSAPARQRKRRVRGSYAYPDSGLFGSLAG